MRNRRCGTDVSNVVRVSGEGKVSEVVLLEDTVGEWKACASAFALVEGSIGISLVLFSSLHTTSNTPNRVPRFIGQF